MSLQHEQGLVQMSETYESTPSALAKELLYYILRVGHFYCDTHFTASREDENGFILCYVVKGRMRVRYCKKDVEVDAGELCFINCKGEYSYSALEPLEYLWINFDGLNTKAFWEEINKQHGMVIQVQNPEQVHKRMIQLVERMRAMESVDEAASSCRLHDIMCSLLYSTSVGEAKDPQIAAAQRYLSQHLAEDLSTTVLAKEFHLSVSQLNRKFRESTGQSPHEYLVQLRMNRAKVLLRESRLSIAEIAEAVGYAYDTSFAAVFRSKVGMSPRQYRNMST